MEYNLEPFKQTFVDESLELISNIESKLLSNGTCNQYEMIDEIFRCAHSIKSSSAMFNLVDLTEFTHVLESHFEKLRKNKTIFREDVVLIIEALDVLREMINAIMVNKKISETKIQNVVHKIKNSSSENSLNQNEKNQESYSYLIEFEPHQDIYRRGDDPLRIIKELQNLGEIECSVEGLKLPELKDYIADRNYLKWKIKICSPFDENKIRTQVFEWLADDSKIKFTELSEGAIAATGSPSTTEYVDNGTVRIDAVKIDQIINIVGELIIAQNTLNHFCEKVKQEMPESVTRMLEHLEINCRKLQDTAIQIRMVPISHIFNKLPRLIHDLSHASHKAINIDIEGQQTELDKSLIEKISDPIIHLIRNCVDHGIEPHAERVVRGKSETGKIKVSCKQQGTNIVISIADDGKGIDLNDIYLKGKQLGLIKENQSISDINAMDLIFYPGFTTKETVSDISGRGVGMDVVKKNIEAINGKILVKTTIGQGTEFEIILPQLLSIIEGQIVRIDSTFYVIPIANMHKTIKVEESKVIYLPDGSTVYKVSDQLVQIVEINSIQKKQHKKITFDKKMLAIIEAEEMKYGLVIDELLDLQQTVIKPMDNEFTFNKYFSGASILPDGSLAFVFNTSRLVDGTLMQRNIDASFRENRGVQ